MFRSNRGKNTENLTANDAVRPSVYFCQYFLGNSTISTFLIIILLGLIAYSNTFNAPFVFDDISSITENPAIKKLDSFWPPSGVRWFGHLTFAINYRLGGLSPIGYHTVNLAIHMLNAFLVYRLVELTLRTPFVISTNKGHGYNFSLVAFFSSLLFLCHPIQTQAVTYIVQRFTSLATLFYLLSLVTYIQFRFYALLESQKMRTAAKKYMMLGLSLVSAILAMKTKEIAFTLPALLVIYEFMFFEGKIKKKILYLIPFIPTMLIIPLTLTRASGPLAMKNGIYETIANVAETQSISRLDYLYTQFRVIMTYIRLLLFPVNQNLDYDYPIYNSFFKPDVLLPFIFLLSVLSVAICLYRLSQKTTTKDRLWFRLISFGIFWFFITLSVESSIIPIRDVIFEHRVYLPSVGFFIVLSSAIGLGVARWGNRVANAYKILTFIMVAVVVSFSVATYARNSVWQEEISLWEDASRKAPGKIRPLNNLGIVYFEKGDLERAIAVYERALSIDPCHTTLYNVSTVYREMGLLNESVAALKDAISLNRWNSKYYVNLGNTLSLIGKDNEAIESYKSALSVNQDDAKANYNLAATLEKIGKLEAAAQSYEKALEIQPDYELADEGHKRVLDRINGGWKKEEMGRRDNPVKSLSIGFKG